MNRIFVGDIKIKLFLIILLGFSLRLIAAINFQLSSASLGYFGFDESVYYSFALHFRETSILEYSLKGASLYFQDYRIWYLEEPLFHHPPLFVWSLYLWHQLWGTSVLASRLLNVLIGTSTIWVAYHIGRRFSERTGLLSALFISISPLLIQQSALILMDTMLSFLLGLFLLSVIRFSERKRSRDLIACSITLALGLWTKYFGILAAAFLIIYIIEKKISISKGTTVISTSIVLFSPWLAWNYSVYGAVVPLETWKKLAAVTQVELPIYAYFIFLPLTTPYVLLGYKTIFKKKKDTLYKGLWAVFLTYLIFFSIPEEKEMRFILPAILPISILSAEAVETLSDKYKGPVLLALVLATIAAGYFIIKGSYYWYLPFWNYTDIF